MLKMKKPTINYHSQVVAQNIICDPDYANYLISLNHQNRRLVPDRVAHYANEITNNKWKNNGETIKVSKSGRLLDGQNRCHAIVKANIAIPILLVTNLDDDVFDTIDTGKNRNGADVLSIQGVKNDTSIAASIRLFLLLEKNNYSGSINKAHKVTNQDILNFYNKKPDYLQDLTKWSHRTAALLNNLVSNSKIAAYAMYFENYSSDEIARTFFEKLLGGSTEIHAFQQFRSMMINSKVTRNTIKATYFHAYLVKTFNNYLMNKQNARISYDQNKEQMPMPINISDRIDFNRN